MEGWERFFTVKHAVLVLFFLVVICFLLVLAGRSEVRHDKYDTGRNSHFGSIDSEDLNEILSEFISQDLQNSSQLETDLDEQPIQEEKPALVSLLTGLPVDEETWSRRPVQISVENHTLARPHSGLAQADIVYEMPVEAQITRFNAIYQTNMPTKVGPERSARVYMLDWVKEYNSVFAHIGYDPKVYPLFSRYGVQTLTSTGAWWDPPSVGRSREHRAYTSVVSLRQRMAERGWTDWSADTFVSWDFTDQELSFLKRPVDGRIEVGFSYASDSYLAVWQYDPYHNCYWRFQADVPHMDAVENQQLKAKNVVLQYTKVWLRAGDSKGRRDMQTIGSGSAVIFRDGQIFEGYWEKTSREARTQFKSHDGSPISLNPGVTWIEIVPESHAELVQYSMQVREEKIIDFSRQWWKSQVESLGIF